ncbi:MAG: hypothetical protein AVDCRST_MAG59-797, partial [uncultured Thermomicrobiales bacterium]
GPPLRAPCPIRRAVPDPPRGRCGAGRHPGRELGPHRSGRHGARPRRRAGRLLRRLQRLVGARGRGRRPRRPRRGRCPARSRPDVPELLHRPGNLAGDPLLPLRVRLARAGRGRRGRGRCGAAAPTAGGGDRWADPLPGSGRRRGAPHDDLRHVRHPGSGRPARRCRRRHVPPRFPGRRGRGRAVHRSSRGRRPGRGGRGARRPGSRAGAARGPPGRDARRPDHGRPGRPRPGRRRPGAGGGGAPARPAGRPRDARLRRLHGRHRPPPVRGLRRGELTGALRGRGAGGVVRAVVAGPLVDGEPQPPFVGVAASAFASPDDALAVLEAMRAAPNDRATAFPVPRGARTPAADPAIPGATAALAYHGALDGEDPDAPLDSAGVAFVLGDRLV